MVTIGVLALQGGFAKHCEMLEKMGVFPLQVKCVAQFDQIDGLILPGGESTTIFKQLKEEGLQEPLLNFSTKKPIFGTCAGLILMAYLDILSIEVKRNAYGRQADSFIARSGIEMIFIRAPKIISIGPQVKVLASYGDSPVFINQGNHFGTTFHPELTVNQVVHKKFIDQVLQVREGALLQSTQELPPRR